MDIQINNQKYNPESIQNGFTLTHSGKNGYIFYKENKKILKLFYENDDIEEYGITIYEDGFNKWIYPSEEKINKKKSDQIKELLDQWLRTSNTPYSLYEPIDKVTQDKQNRQRWKKFGVDKLLDGFTLIPDGRCGAIFYKDGENIMELPFEYALGSADFDILIFDNKFDKWILPNVQEIDPPKSSEIKKALDQWLQEKGIRYSF